MILGGGLDPEYTRAPFDHVQIQLEYAVAAQNQGRHGRQGEFESFPEGVGVRGKEQVLDQLLRDGGRASRHFSGIGAVLDHLAHLSPIDSIIPVEVAVFRRDHRMLELGRNAAQGYERLAFLVRVEGEERLNSPLDLYPSREWVDKSQP